MSTILCALLLVTVFLITSRADEAVTQSRSDEENAETKSDIWSDQSTTTVQDQLDNLKILVRILMQDVQAVRIGQGRLENNILSRLEEVEETLTEKCMMDASCKNDTDAQIHKGYKDCQAVYDAGYTTSGVYKIKLNGVTEKDVYCDQVLYGGGWTVFQRRMDGSVNFYRGWDDYTQGFGDAAGEYWLGNEYLHQLTANRNTQLLVELEEGGDTAYAHYSQFWTGNSTSNFRFHVGGFTDGTNNPGDSLLNTFNYHNDQSFSTWDKDNDNYSTGSCAQKYHGAWWFNKCFRANLNGVYNGGSDTGIYWRTWKSLNNLSGTRMMMKTKWN